MPEHTHPQWCDPRCCETTDSDVAHSSAPDRWATCDGKFYLALVRADEFMYPPRRGTGTPELRLEVAATSYTSEPPLPVYLSVPEARELIARLCIAVVRAEHDAG